MTFGWNNSYQNLKHDRINSLKFGSVSYLFDIMAALFLLNLYYKDDNFKLEKSKHSFDLDNQLGSEIFSVKVHKWYKYDGAYNYGKKEDFDECTYITKMTDDSYLKNYEFNKKVAKKQTELFISHPKFLEFLKTNKLKEYKGNNLMLDVLGGNDYSNLFRLALSSNKRENLISDNEAVVNKHNIDEHLSELKINFEKTF